MTEHEHPIQNEEMVARIREQAERLGNMLREQRGAAARHRAILAAIADGVIVTDKSCFVALANRAAYQILNLGSCEPSGGGASEAALVGQPVSTLFAACSPESQAELRRAVRAVLAQDARGETGAESRCVLSCDNKRLVKAQLSPLRDEEQGFSGTVIVLRDVTAEQEIARVKNDFVSLVSHELRTPMTSIKGYTDLMLKGSVGELNDQQRRFMTIVKSNVDRMAELVSDLLDVSRLESGRMRLARERLDLASVVFETSQELVETLRQRELTLQFDLSPGLPRVYADHGRVIQVLLNLLSNAYRYTPAGGTITISVHQERDEVQVDVTDTGIGIPQQEQATIFERFYRVDHPVVQQQAGTGLGLPIAKSLIEMHGGRLWLRSKPGQGSTFSFTLPRYTEDEKLPEQDSSCEGMEARLANRVPGEK